MYLKNISEQCFFNLFIMNLLDDIIFNFIQL